MRILTIGSLIVFVLLEWYAITGLIQSGHVKQWHITEAKLSGANVEAAPGTSSQYRLDIGFTYRCRDKVYYSNRYSIREVYGQFQKMKAIADSLKDVAHLSAHVNPADCRQGVLSSSTSVFYCALAPIMPLLVFIPLLFALYYKGKSLTVVYSRRIDRLRRLFGI
jgi:hypothetical protein